MKCFDAASHAHELFPLYMIFPILVIIFINTWKVKWNFSGFCFVLAVAAAAFKPLFSRVLRSKKKSELKASLISLLIQNIYHKLNKLTETINYASVAVLDAFSFFFFLSQLTLHAFEWTIWIFFSQYIQPQHKGISINQNENFLSQ